jgi:hypothetical protein
MLNRRMPVRGNFVVRGQFQPDCEGGDLVHSVIDMLTCARTRRVAPRGTRPPCPQRGWRPWESGALVTALRL